MTSMKTLILGGVRSGKSRLAERLATESQLPVTYIATATIEDEEMRERIASHRMRRPDHWRIIEEPVELAAVLSQRADSKRCLLVDCLTLWLTNLLTHPNISRFDIERSAFVKVLPGLTGRLILVSNETNMGIIPMGELSRRYCDEAGKLHQEIAQHCDQVVLTAAGLPLMLKGEHV
ncbi:bifunctional adenosylcobinamide kinase/adenosylcobinamide-phosphate guanylyltransferase [Nitrosomonas sp. Nm166]|uniref:bifunctional adenosylcobinamide kinase/adenosylcobinamide-phosphate guanylyltransferase n=1 Tax=Nitrosomonas sp. Nm166 TaxID=1881054 RepID=UPI0008EE14FE|nr:bifunctional adenosylcobinamide kinase/adenosylcobinamide-phosphate guanylyltransferase [Nitrosomonas sp. Nm166]SFE34005.1 adenosylcobinamide kinase / adenosylcobinamide-phosphate guanylyltransferase [Nitrosomonas sp. Nm166]